MENQKTPIKGYRDLSQPEIDLINEIKAHGEALEVLTQKVRDHVGNQYQTAFDNNDQEEDKRLTQAQPDRWLNIGITNLQQGLMALTRTVAQSTNF
ncbi:TPA: DUF7681 family protein [Acinetobacter baumannii]|uniref:Acb2/Tad1 domain-containing protein n=1 Tax=Acinetobacter calcoaceticus/baumannii complex TaxID=909768 RepID=UPI00124F7B5F|nr:MULTISPECIES: hypothetical protein [Acinetobacter calcoaceticus/baumannii complex]MDV4248572.1 hypothetical protein [Acinetobacter baumannii]MDV4287616.1 hypothetical protein [Acinetobacter baumannii]HEN9526050.1 hypothetical protein [Acinetobacter baumannii]HEN9553714.1 hypothetical protein [Acinetobacter baumannii]